MAQPATNGEKRYYPFHCGSQFWDWENANCDRCQKSSPDASRCDLQLALVEACFGDGSVSESVAERIGYLDHCPPRQEGFSYLWPCQELELIEVVVPDLKKRRKR